MHARITKISMQGTTTDPIAKPLLVESLLLPADPVP